MPRTLRLALLAVAAPALVLLPGCGDDDDEGEDASAGTTAPGATAPGAETTSTAGGAPAGGDQAAFCTALVDAQAGINALNGPDGDPDAVRTTLEQVEGQAPSAIEEPVATMVDEARSALDDPEGAGPGEAFYAASSEVVGWATGNCDLQTIDVTAREYEFEGIDGPLPAGPAAISLSNAGEEQHEIVVFRINDDVTQSIEELLQLSEEESAGLVAFQGAAFAEPDESAATLAVLEPGRYAAVCFLPVGSTPEAVAAAEESDTEVVGPPHFVEGMVTEFEVS